MLLRRSQSRRRSHLLVAGRASCRDPYAGIPILSALAALEAEAMAEAVEEAVVEAMAAANNASWLGKA